MEVRRLKRHEVDLYRATRMRALADSPDAFGESVADAESMPPSFWVETVERFTTSPDSILFIACEGAEVCGSVSGRLMRPPVLTAEQAAVFSRALAGTAPGPDDAAVLGSRWHEVASALASRTERDPRLMFDFLTGSGLGFADVARILPFPPPGGFHRRPGGPGGGPPGNDPHGHGLGGHPPPPFMFPACVTVMIGGMWVAPEHRRRGLGRLLMDTVIAWAESKGAERLELGVAEGNDPAISLYKKLGFKIADRRLPPMPDHAGHFLFMERDMRLAPPDHSRDPA